MDISKLTTMFVSPEERPVAVLGNNAAETFLSTGVLGNGFAVLSNKRVYFRGRCFTRTGKRFSIRSEERVVDVQNITGTGFIYNDPTWLAVLATIFAVLSLFAFGEAVKWPGYRWLYFLVALSVAGICGIFYQVKRRTLFEISFAGGGIAFNVSWFPKEEAQFFQKNLKLVGDALKGQEKRSVGGFSVADELGKLAQLRAQGIITQEEYETQKRKLIT